MHVQASRSLPGYISATELRAHLPAILQELEFHQATVVVCRWNKPAAILRGAVDADGQPVIHFIPVQSERGQQLLRAARRSA
jgi:hypothetical protein